MDDNDRWQDGTLPPDPEADAAPYGGKVLAFRGGAAHDPDRLPESADAEARLCGLVVAQEGAGYADLAAVARVDDFSDPAWRLVWGIVGEQVERAAPVDFPSVAERVQEAPVTDGGPPWSTRLAAGGSSGLDALAWAMGEASAGTAVAYATVVRETASRRAVILGCRRLAAQAGLKSTRLEDLARACDALGEGLRQSTTVERSMYAVGDEADLVLEAARKRAEGERVRSFTTGYDALDQHLDGGLLPGEFVVIGGRPAMGKTAFALSLALKSARRSVGVLILSLELMRSLAVMRILGQEARLPTSLLKSGHAIGGKPMDTTEYRRGLEAVDRLRGLPLLIQDIPSLTVADVRGAIRMARGMCADLGIVVVDYLQIMNHGGRGSDSQHLRIAETAQALRNMSKTEGLAILALSQLNREVDKRPDQRPILADLRDSGAIEAAATQVWFPWRKSVLNPNDRDPAFQREAKVIVAKNTSGRTGEVPFAWHAEYQEFVAAEERYEQQGDAGRGRSARKDGPGWTPEFGDES